MCCFTFSSTTARGHREMPSARTLFMSRICLAVWFYLRVISSRPSILMSRPARLSLVPPHRSIHVTAATLSPRYKRGSPCSTGVSCFSTSMTQLVATIPSNSKKLIVMVQVSRRLAFSSAPVLNSAVSRNSCKFPVWTISTDRVEARVRQVVPFPGSFYYRETGGT